MKKVRTELEQALADMRRTFYVIGFFSFFINLLVLTAPLYMLQMFDRVLSSRSEATLIARTIIAFGMLLIMRIVEAIRSRFLVRIGAG